MVTEGTLLTNIATASFWAADQPGIGSVMRTTFSVTAFVYVVNPMLQLRKLSSPTMQCSGGTVTFCIYVVNMAQFSSAFNVVVEDIMPGDNGAGNMGFAYVNGGQTYWNPQSPTATITPGYRWWAVTPVSDTWGGEPSAWVTGIYYIRWAINVIGPGRSLMVCFKATIL